MLTNHNTETPYHHHITASAISSLSPPFLRRLFLHPPCSIPLRPPPPAPKLPESLLAARTSIAKLQPLSAPLIGQLARRLKSRGQGSAGVAETPETLHDPPPSNFTTFIKSRPIPSPKAIAPSTVSSQAPCDTRMRLLDRDLPSCWLPSRRPLVARLPQTAPSPTVGAGG